MAKYSRKNMDRRVTDLRSDSTLDSYNITFQNPFFHLLFSQSIRSAYLVPSTMLKVWPRAFKPFKHRTLPTWKLPFTGVGAGPSSPSVSSAHTSPSDCKKQKRERRKAHVHPLCWRKQLALWGTGHRW